MKFQKHKDSRLFVPDYLENYEIPLEERLNESKYEGIKAPKRNLWGAVKFGLVCAGLGIAQLLYSGGCKPKKHPIFFPPTATSTGTDTGTGTGTGTNLAPTITTTGLSDAVENQSYLANVQATDPENDDLTFSKLSGSSWLSVSSAGAVSGTPADAHVGPASLEVQVSDNNSNTASKTLNFNVKNVTQLSLQALNLENDSAIQGVILTLNGGTYVGASDSSGNIIISNILDGSYSAQFNKTGFLLFDAGKITLSKARETAGKTSGLIAKLIPSTLDLTDYNTSCIQEYGYSQRWEPTDIAGPLSVYMITTNIGDNSAVPAEAIAVQQNVLTNYINAFTDGKVNSFLLKSRATPWAGLAGSGESRLVEGVWNTNLLARGGNLNSDGYGDETVPIFKYGRVIIRGPPPVGAIHQADYVYTHEAFNLYGAEDNFGTGSLDESNPIIAVPTPADIPLADIIVGKILYNRSPGHTLNLDTNDPNYDYNK